MCCYWLVLSFLAILPIASLATPATQWGNNRVKHAWNSLPGNWAYLSDPSNSTTIDLRIALKPQSENALIEALYEVSSPSHPKYGKHLSREQAAELVAPHSETLEHVTLWLKDSGVPSSSISTLHSGNWLTIVNLPVYQANELLDASYQLYRHTETNHTILRTMSYALPETLQDLVQTMSPTTYFHSPRTLREVPHMHSGRGVEEVADAPGDRLEARQYDNNGTVTPLYLRELYNTLNYVPNATEMNVVGIASFLGYYPRKDDIDPFMEKYRPDAVGIRFSVVQINGGGYSTGEPSTQGDLTMEYSLALTYPIDHILYSTGGAPPFKPDSGEPSGPPQKNEPYLDFLAYLLEQPFIPQTITSSYADDEQTVPMDYAMAVCNLFAQVAVRGVSFVVHSGFFGVGSDGGNIGGKCQANDGSGKVQFIPQFPATCPYVTSVGGTMDNTPEIAAPDSGGGFSNYFGVPPFQSSAVPTYLKNLGIQNSGLFNTSGRGHPDVATQFHNLSVIVNGWSYQTYGDTSAIFGSIISLLNDYRLYQNQSTLGFLNPWLYGSGKAGFNDITSGSNSGCGPNGSSGFPAVVGWDAVTGLGTPDFVKLQGVLPQT